MDAHVAELINFYHLLTRESLSRMGDFYASTAYFKDPFNEVNSLEEIRIIFIKMFSHLRDAKFNVTESITQNDSTILVWDFTFRIPKYQPDITQRIRGVSHIRFDANGKVHYHRDYWDAAEELYEKLPGIGALMRFMKKRVG